MNNPIASAIKQISDEKGIPQEQIIEALEAALAAAYRKDFGEKNQNVKVEFDIKTGESRVFDIKTVVEDMEEVEEVDETEAAPSARSTSSEPSAEGEEEKKKFNPKTELMITAAQAVKEDAQIGDVIKTELVVPSEYGRMAAQTAKQVIIQKIREAERNMLFAGFKDKEGTILVGTVQRREEMRVLVDFGRVTAIMPISEQIPRERYMSGDRIKVYVVSVASTIKGPEIIVSRSHPNMVKMVFESEIPEIASGSIDIKGIARDAGSRSKVSVVANVDSIDPIGSCIGQRGSRIQTIISELGGEKIDVIQFDENSEKYIGHALSPAKIQSIELNDDEHRALVNVKDDQLSLAIGKHGQNVRLASQLTGWHIEVKSERGASSTGDEFDETATLDESPEPTPSL
ncbi:transcription termination/antitermination protein NusA [Candidatus Uhrbacteria bacterium]|nr:transcription termination/antitermination protein NusA [Candidatus Uhrbacteria bacterium]